MDFFKQMAKGKLPAAYLLTFRGEPWTAIDRSIQLRAAIASANSATRLPLAKQTFAPLVPEPGKVICLGPH